MKRESWGGSGLLALLSFGAAVWMPAPLHADGTHRTPATAPGRRARQEPPKARQEPPKEGVRPSAEELRAQAERDRIQKERIEKRRQEAQKERAGPAGQNGTRNPPASIEERREIARKAAHFESSYRSHAARITRLIGIYKARGDDERVAQLERMREKLELRREHAMEGFRKDLGEPGFQRVQGQINGKGRRGLEERAKDKEESPKDKPPGGPGGGR